MFLDEKVTCPGCGVQRSLRLFRLSNDVLEIAKMAAKFGGRWPWVLEYITGFQMDHDQPMKPSRMLILIKEIESFIEKKGFRFERKDHSVRPEALFQAMRTVALKNMTGLKTHSYLFKVAIDFNLKMIQGEDREQKEKAEEAMKRDPDGKEKIERILEGLR